MLIFKSNSLRLNRRIVHLIPFFDLMDRKAFDCVNSTQKKCKWKQHRYSHLTFDSSPSFFFLVQRTFFPERREEKKKMNVIHHCIDLVSHPFLLLPSPSSIEQAHSKKKFVKLDEREREKREESKSFFSRSKRIKIRWKMRFIWILSSTLNTGSIWVLQLLAIVVGVSY